MGKRLPSGTGFSSPKPPKNSRWQSSYATRLIHKAKQREVEQLLAAGRLRDAEASLYELINNGARSPYVYTDLARVCGMQGKYQVASHFLYKALELKPDYPVAHNNLGNVYKELGHYELAAASYKMAISCKQDYPEAHNNLGVLLQELGKVRESASSYKRALALMPDYAEAHNNLGVVLQACGMLDESISSFKAALLINSQYPEALLNLGNALRECGDQSAAISAYNQALLYKPGWSAAQKSLALVELQNGDFKSGWKRYEYRLQTSTDLPGVYANPPCMRWRGEICYPSTRLLVVSEQGLGDTLQFMRYLIALRTRGFTVSICPPPKLHTLIQESGLDPSPLTRQQAESFTNGLWTPLLSVPGLLKVSSSNAIISQPYIKTSKTLIRRWKDLFSFQKRPIIGISWQGNPDAEKTHLRGRSLTLEQLSPLFSSLDATFVSLQKGFGAEQLKSFSFRDRFVDAQCEVNNAWDFLDTAAIIANCDLVVTTDTAVAHLSGGMGMPTWLLLKKVPDWRWGLKGDRTFWYPSVRLFRQQILGDWTDVVKSVASELLLFNQMHTESSLF